MISAGFTQYIMQAEHCDKSSKKSAAKSDCNV